MRHLSIRALRALGLILVAAGVGLTAGVVLHRLERTNTGIDGVHPVPDMVILPPGEFMMGTPEDEEGRYQNETLHRVEIRSRFALSCTEVTQGQYQAVMGVNATVGYCSKMGVADTNPVVCVSWHDAVLFCNRLSVIEGLEPAYEIAGDEVKWDKESLGYRLPTEAEWEYAARAGTRDRYAGTDRDAEVCLYGNVADSTALEFEPYGEGGTFPCRDGHARLAPVATYLPNAWGLYDMTGNVWEWVWDRYGEYWETVDPAGPLDGTDRVHRGGAWAGTPRGEIFWIWASPRVAARGWLSPNGRNISVGFRVARSLP